MADVTVSDAPMSFDAAMDDATVEQIEKGAQAKGTGQQRRCALMAVSRDSQTLLKMATEAPEAFDEFANAVLGYHEYIKAQMEIASAAVARIAIVHDLSEAA